MNSSQFVYSVPIFSQPHSIYQAPTTYPCYFMIPPYYSYQPLPVVQSQIQPFGLKKSQESTLRLNSQENKQNDDQSSYLSSNEDLLYESTERKNHRIERLRDNKGRYYGIRKLPLKQKYKQNPKRNVITNIGNQLLAFASNRSRSTGIIKQIAPQWTQEDIGLFFQFMGNLRKTTDYYLNITKMKQLWYPLTSTPEEIRNRYLSMFRSISSFYLNNMIRLFVLNSAKIKRSSKIFHIKSIRSLIKELAPRTEI